MSSGASTVSFGSPSLASSSGTASTTTMNDNGSTSSRQSPMLSQGQLHSYTPNRAHSTKSTRRVRHDSYERDEPSSKSGVGLSNHQQGGYSFPSSASTDGHISNTASPRDDWWEHVLPPGQLAERLRRAQASSTLNANDGSKSSRKSILRNATPSERKTWTSLADFGGQPERTQHLNRSDGNSTRSSVGSLPSIKSDVSSISATSSGTEESAFERLSSPAKDDMAYQWDRSATASPTLMPTIHRSTSLRRSRVVADNDSNSIGLGLGVSKTSDVDDKLRLWNFNTAPASSTSHNNHLRPFPSTTGGRHSPLHILEDTPEVSSEEEQGVKRDRITSSTTTTRTVRRISRTSSSVRNLESVFDGPSSYSDTRHGDAASSSRRQSWTNSTSADRHVSFMGRGNGETLHNQTIGRAAGRIQSMVNDPTAKRRTWQVESPRRAAKISSSSSGTFPTPQYSQFRERRRTTCYSAPTSPKAELLSLHPDKTAASTPASLRRSVKPTSTGYDPHMALYSSSASLTQTGMASAGNIALTLTRQLSVPLRPMLQLTMFLSISSFTCMALAGFLIAGYMVTAWDDVNNRGKKIHSNVSSVTRRVEAGLQWCEKLITGEDSFHHRPSSSIVTAPIRFAFAVPTTIAYKLTPTSISESLGFNENAPPMSSSHQRSSPTPSSSHAHSQSTSSIPPRPPLSSLLPSIFLTIMIALGAGLASFFASRGAAAPSRSSHFSTTTTSPLSTAIPPHASSHIPIRKRQSMQSQARRHSYDVMAM